MKRRVLGFTLLHPKGFSVVNVLSPPLAPPVSTWFHMEFFFRAPVRGLERLQFFRSHSCITTWLTAVSVHNEHGKSVANLCFPFDRATWYVLDLRWFDTGIYALRLHANCSQLLLCVAFTRLQNDGAVFVRTSISLQAMISTLVSKRSKSKTHPTHRTAQGSDRMIWISRYSDIGWHWHILTPIVCFKVGNVGYHWHYLKVKESFQHKPKSHLSFDLSQFSGALKRWYLISII